jgi:hypothetical protein
VQSSQATLGMLREQDRKERRKLLATLGDKLPKGVKVWTLENIYLSICCFVFMFLFMWRFPLFVLC